MTKEELEKEADKQSYLYDTKYSEDYTLEDRLNRPKDFVKGAIKDLVDLLKRKAYRDGYIAGAKAILEKWRTCYLSCSSPYCAFPNVKVKGELGQLEKKAVENN